MSNKRCFKCGEIKDFSAFYKHSAMSDGYLNKCKECTKKDASENRKNKIGYYREYDRCRGNRQDLQYIKEYRARYPKKYKAHCAINNAVRDGRLIKPTHCEVCNSDFHVEGHHDDYNKILEVRWLCAVCHKTWHVENGEGLNPV